MRGMLFKGNRKVELLNFEDLTPGPGEAVVEMKASGMCGSDLHFYRHSPADVIRSLGFKDLASRGIDENAPIIGGHEPCGVIAAVGSGVDRNAFKVGDRVMAFIMRAVPTAIIAAPGGRRCATTERLSMASSSMAATPTT